MARGTSLAEQLYHKGLIDRAEFEAAGQVRNLYLVVQHLVVQPWSEGVSSYGQAPGGSASPHRKADRKARALTGIEIAENGTVSREKTKPNRDSEYRLQSALFAMCGCTTDEGDKVVDWPLIDIVLSACLGNAITQTEIGNVRSLHRSEKQMSGIGASVVRECLKKGALHFRMAKGEAWK